MFVLVGCELKLFFSCIFKFFLLSIMFSIIPVSVSYAVEDKCSHNPFLTENLSSGWVINLLTYSNRLEAEGLVNRLEIKHFIATTLKKHTGLQGGKGSGLVSRIIIG